MADTVHESCTNATETQHVPCTTAGEQGRTILDMQPKETKKLIGQRIKLLRERKGGKLNPQAKTAAQKGRAYSQSRLALDSQQAARLEGGEHISFTKQQIANYEQGSRTPAPWDAGQLAKLLDASPAYILCLDEGQPILSAGEIDLIMAFRQLPLEKRADFTSRVCELAEAYRSPHVRIADPAQPLHNTESSGTPEEAPKGQDEREKPHDPSSFAELVKTYGEDAATRIVHSLVEQHAARVARKSARDKKSPRRKLAGKDRPKQGGAANGTDPPPLRPETGKRGVGE